MSEQHGEQVSRKKQVNEKLRRARLRQFLTVSDAANRLAVSRTTFTRWEQGYQKPHLVSLSQLCHLFNASPTELGFGDIVNDDIIDKENPHKLMDIFARRVDSSQNSVISDDHALLMAAMINVGYPQPTQQVLDFNVEHATKTCWVTLTVRSSPLADAKLMSEYKRLSGYDLTLRRDRRTS